MKKPVWTFRLSDPIAQLKEVSLVENISFWSSESKYWFYGYTTQEELKAEIWGKEVKLNLLIHPLETPREKLPIEYDIPLESISTMSLSEEQKTWADQLQSKIKLLTEENLQSSPTEELERQYWSYVDQKQFVEIYQKAANAWMSQESDMAVKCQQTGVSLAELYELFKDLRLPDELMRDDTQFALILSRVLQFSQTVEDFAEKNGVKLPLGVHELSEFIDSLLDQMIESGNKLFGVEREMTPKERKAHRKIKSDALDTDKPLEERLKIMKQIWENPLVNSDEKIEYLEKALQLIQEDVLHIPNAIPCPDSELIERQLSAISSHLKWFEAEGKETWSMRVAEGLMESMKVWREDSDLPVLTQEEFAAIISLGTLEINSQELADGSVNFVMNLHFYDEEDSFDGHTLYMVINNQTVEEITLMG